MSQSFEVVVRQTNGLIDFNYEDLKKNISLAVKPFTEMVVTEDAIGEAKKIRANLNNFKKALDDKRKEVKKAALNPYEDFEVKVKELIGIIDVGVNNLDSQVKKYEDDVATQKLARIHEYFKSKNFDIVLIDRLFDPKWLNVGCKDDQWKKEMDTKIENIMKDLGIIEMMDVENKNTLKAMYVKYLDITIAKTAYDELKAMTIAIGGQDNKDEEVVKVSMETSPKPLYRPVYSEEPLLERIFRVIATEKQLIYLSGIMNEAGIQFSKVGDV